MISYNQWKLLNEAFMGSIPLGISYKQSIGIQSNIPGIGEATPEVSEAGFGGMGMGMGDFGDMPPELPMKKKKKAPLGDDLGDEEDLDHDEEDLDHDEEDLDRDEEDLDRDELDLDRDEEDLDRDELGDEDMDMLDMPKKKNLPDKLHNNTPFMAYMKKRMKKEDHCPDGDEEDHPHDELGHDRDHDEDEEGHEDKPAFLMKKGMYMKKGMKKGMKKKMKKESVEEAYGHKEGCKCKMCKGMKKESTETSKVKLSDYARPKDYNANETNEEWIKSVTGMCSSKEINRKFDSGFQAKEDILLPPPAEIQAQTQTTNEPGPGEVGWAPQGRIGGPLGSSGMAETTDQMLKLLSQMDDLQKKFDGK